MTRLPDETIDRFGSMAPPDPDEDIKNMIKAILDESESPAKESPEHSQEAHKKRKFRFSPLCDWELNPPEWLVDELIEKNTLVSLFGPSNSGKSFYALGLAFSVATGVPFFGREVERGPVAYILGEGYGGITRRRVAWETYYQTRPLDVYGSEMAASFLDPESVQEVSDAAKEIAEEKGPLKLIVVDTLARNFGAGDENSNADMSIFITALDRLRLEHPGATILVVHHSGLGDKSRGRGASALRGALDTELRVEGSDGHVAVTVTKQKEGPTGGSWNYKLTEVDLGIQDKKGNPVKSLVLVPTEEDRSQRVAKRSKGAERGLKAWREAAEKYGQIDENGDFIGVHNKDWGEVMKSRSIAKNATAKNTEFCKAKKALCVEHSWLVVCDDMYKLGPAIDQGEYEMKIIAEKLRAKKGWSPQEKPKKMNSQDPENGSTVGNDSLVLPLPKCFQVTPVTPRPDPKSVTPVTTPLGVVTGNTGGNSHGDNSRVFEDGEKTGYTQEDVNSKTHINEPELPRSRDSHPSCGNALSVSELARLMGESEEEILIGLDDLNKCREESGLPPALEVDRGTGQVALLARSPDGDLPDDLDDEEDEELEVVEEIPEEAPPEEEPTKENPSPCGDPGEDVRAPGPPDDPPEYQTDDPEYLNSLECLEHLENLEGEEMSW